jgi:hypothetical protein
MGMGNLQPYLYLQNGTTTPRHADKLSFYPHGSDCHKINLNISVDFLKLFSDIFT